MLWKYAKRTPVELVISIFLLVAGWSLHRLNVDLENYYRSEVDTGEISNLPNGKALRMAALGFERLLADLYWIRTLFYVGSEAAQDANYPSVEGLAHLVTDIDPQYHSVYVLMSSVIGGMRYDPEAAIRLLEKGARHSDYWRIHFLLGFYYFMELGDYESGAEHLKRAVDLGGPPYLPLLVSRLYTQSGRAEAAILFLQARLKQEKEPWIIRNLQRRLRDVMIHRDLHIIDGAIAKYEAAHGEAPQSLSQLTGAGLRVPTLDPAGQPYSIVDGKSESRTEYDALRILE